MNNREQFEEWVDSNFPFKKDRFHIFRDEYKSQFTRQLWEAWQASRAAVEIKLPTENELHQKVCSQCASESLEMVEEAIRSSGIKVKDC